MTDLLSLFKRARFIQWIDDRGGAHTLTDWTIDQAGSGYTHETCELTAADSVTVTGLHYPGHDFRTSLSLSGAVQISPTDLTFLALDQEKLTLRFFLDAGPAVHGLHK